MLSTALSPSPPEGPSTARTRYGTQLGQYCTANHHATPLRL
jgi:hypothetical protein